MPQLLIGSESYDNLKSSHRGWVEEYLGNGAECRQDEWTSSIAVGSESFVEKVKSKLGFKAKGRGVIEGVGRYQLREEAAHYETLFRAEKDDTDPENSYFWDGNTE